MAIDGWSRSAADPWPTWEYQLPDGVRVVQEIVVAHGGGGTVVSWRVAGVDVPVTLEVRPFFSGRDYHSLHHENAAFAFEPETVADSLTWRVYAGLPPIRMSSNGTYRAAASGIATSFTVPNVSVASTIVRIWPALVCLRGRSRRGGRGGAGAEHARAGCRGVRQARAGGGAHDPRNGAPTPFGVYDPARSRRGRVSRATGQRPIDRGRLSLVHRLGPRHVHCDPGLCIATGRLTEARDILLEWSAAVSGGMLPNRFADSGETPEFNAVDASLWFVIAVQDLLDRVGSDTAVMRGMARARLQRAVQEIVQGYADGTRYGIHADADGLLAAGEPGVQLTWMDARVDGREITPRIGKPVEVQALWLNALWSAAQTDARWASVYALGRRSFDERFWNAERSCLYDVVDENHTAGRHDGTIRPNQILAIGGLPIALVDGDRARAIVDVVERVLLTPFGLRSLAPAEPGYASRYEGGPSQRDGIYHQGIVWPWLMGPFVDAWVRVRGSTPAARQEARARFVAPLLEYVAGKGLGHLWEITDAEWPYQGRGCPFQAWSLGELIRVDRQLSAV